jgi:hypothetical protein
VLRGNSWILVSSVLSLLKHYVKVAQSLLSHQTVREIPLRELPYSQINVRSPYVSGKVLKYVMKV